jgi:DNA-binding transcriptional LysR family regulator
MDMTKQRFLSQMEIDLLITLVSVPSFTEAAIALELTQPAVSRAVNRLEEHFGVELLTRGKEGCEATQELLRLQPGLWRARQALEELNTASGPAKSELAGKIRVVGFRSAISVLLPEAVSAFMARHRRVRISLSTIPEIGGGVQKVVMESKADFGLTTVRPSRALRSVHIGSDPYTVVRRKGTRRPSPRESLVLWNERCSEIVPKILQAHRWNPIETMSVDHDMSVLAMVEHGAGYSIMPRLATQPLSSALSCHPLAVPFRRDIWLCGRREIWDTATGKAFRRAVVEDLSKKLSMLSV